MGLNLDLLTQVWEWISGICISASSSGGCDRRAKCSREELPHYRGHGQKLGGPHALRAVAKRSYSTYEVRGAAERRYPASEVRGCSLKEIPHAPKPKARGRTERSNPTPEARGGGKEDQLHVQGAVAAWVQEGLEDLSHVEGQEGQW